MYALTNCRLFVEGSFISGQVVLIKDGLIEDVLEEDSLPENAQPINCEGNYVAPGLIDLQIYGAGGCLFANHPNEETLGAVARAIVKSGTTGFLITLPTNTLEEFRKAIKVVKQNPHPALMGIHLEGPYINPKRRGAHLIDCIRKPVLQEVQSLLDEAEGTVKMITLAPELTGPEIIECLLKNKVVISAGHSDASYCEAMKGFERGIRATTHLFNAMSPLHHRDTGLPGATFQSNAFAGIIADGVHVDYPTLSISKKLMGDRLFLISDAVEETMDGAYIHVRTPDRFTLPDGTLSGSQLTLLQAVKNCVQKANIPIDEAIKMATLYPSRVMQMKNMGVIEKGAAADLIRFDDELKLRGVYMRNYDTLLI